MALKHVLTLEKVSLKNKTLTFFLCIRIFFFFCHIHLPIILPLLFCLLLFFNFNFLGSIFGTLLQKHGFF